MSETTETKTTGEQEVVATTTEEKQQKQQTELLKNLNKKLGKGVGEVGKKILSGGKKLFTGNVDQTQIKGINSIIYFISLTGIMNIIYFLFFEEINVYMYSLLCIVIPIVGTIFVSSSGKSSLGQLVQKIFFTDKEITIILISSLIVFLLTLI